MNIIKQIWKDPVWSNVIAGLILLILVAMTTIFVPPVKRVVLDIFNFALQNPFMVSTLILAAVVVYMFFRIKRNSLRTHKQIPSPSNWLSNLSDEQLANFRFLFWFPLHHTLKTAKYYSDSETVDHIPEIRDLIENRVLKIVMENVIEYSIEIDKDCYKFMEELFRSISEVDRGKQLFVTLRSTDFIMLFSKQSHF